MIKNNINNCDCRPSISPSPMPMIQIFGPGVHDVVPLSRNFNITLCAGGGSGSLAIQDLKAGGGGAGACVVNIPLISLSTIHLEVGSGGSPPSPSCGAAICAGNTGGKTLVNIQSPQPVNIVVYGGGGGGGFDDQVDYVHGGGGGGDGGPGSAPSGGTGGFFGASGGNGGSGLSGPEDSNMGTTMLVGMFAVSGAGGGGAFRRFRTCIPNDGGRSFTFPGGSAMRDITNCTGGGGASALASGGSRGGRGSMGSGGSGQVGGVGTNYGGDGIVIIRYT